MKFMTFVFVTFMIMSQNINVVDNCAIFLIEQELLTVSFYSLNEANHIAIPSLFILVLRYPKRFFFRTAQRFIYDYQIGKKNLSFYELLFICLRRVLSILRQMLEDFTSFFLTQMG